MRKIANLVCMVTVAVIVVVSAYGNDSISQEMMEKLVDALWRDLPESIDITLYEQLDRKPRTESEIERIVRDIYSADDELDGTHKPAEEFDAEVRQEVSRIMKEQSTPKILMKRVVVAGANHRVDITTIREPSDAEGPFQETLANVVAKDSGVISSYKIDHRQKVGSLLKGRWSREEHLTDLGTSSSGSRLLLKFLLGKVEKGAGDGVLIIRDEAKISACVKGSEEAAKITRAVETGTDGRQVDVLTVFTPDAPHFIGKWYLDSSDYNICYREEFFNPLTGAPMAIREHGDFFAVEGTEYMYPRHSTLTWFSPEDGSIIKSKDIVVETVSFGDVDPSLFAFAPPMDYAIVDFRHGKPIIIQPEERGHGEVEKMLEEVAEGELSKPEKAVTTEKEKPVLSAEGKPPFAEPEVAVAETTPPSSNWPVYVSIAVAASLLILAAIIVVLRRKAIIRQKGKA